jgi:N-acetylglutamate synthase-like GNAT family acetyltransferase
VSEGLMTEFFNRAKGEGVKFITTGFFRPEYFYKFGFKIAPKYSGLVKELS